MRSTSRSCTTAMPARSAALPVAAKLYEKTMILRGFSKSHAMTGWRLGYAAGPEAVISQMTKLQQYTFVCAPSPLQYAALKALDVPMDDAVAAYRRKRDWFLSGCRRKFEVVKPAGRVLHLPQGPRRHDCQRVRRPGDREQCADHPRQCLLRARHPFPHQLRDDRREDRRAGATSSAPSRRAGFIPPSCGRYRFANSGGMNPALPDFYRSSMSSGI